MFALIKLKNKTKNCCTITNFHRNVCECTYMYDMCVYALIFSITRPKWKRKVKKRAQFKECGGDRFKENNIFAFTEAFGIRVERNTVYKPSLFHSHPPRNIPYIYYIYMQQKAAVSLLHYTFQVYLIAASLT